MAEKIYTIRNNGSKNKTFVEINYSGVKYTLVLRPDQLIKTKNKSVADQFQALNTEENPDLFTVNERHVLPNETETGIPGIAIGSNLDKPEPKVEEKKKDSIPYHLRPENQKRGPGRPKGSGKKEE